MVARGVVAHDELVACDDMFGEGQAETLIQESVHARFELGPEVETTGPSRASDVGQSADSSCDNKLSILLEGLIDLR